jgi:hypothetical protein
LKRSDMSTQRHPRATVNSLSSPAPLRQSAGTTLATPRQPVARFAGSRSTQANLKEHVLGFGGTATRVTGDGE